MTPNGGNNIITTTTTVTSSPAQIKSPKHPTPVNMEDLIHLPGPLTEDAVMRTLQARFNDSKYFVSFFFLFLIYDNLRIG